MTMQNGTAADDIRRRLSTPGGIQAGAGVQAGTGIPTRGEPSVTEQGIRPDIRTALEAAQAAERDPNKGSPEDINLVPQALIDQLLQINPNFTFADLQTIVANRDPFLATPAQAVQELIDGQLQTQRSQQQLAPQDPRQFNQTFEDLQVKAIQDGNFDLANQVRQFQEQPSDIEAFNAAVQLATSPADIATLSAIARGVFPRQAPSPGNVESLPLSPALQRAGQNLFGAGAQQGLPAPSGLPQAQDAVQVPPQVSPEVPPPAPRPLTIEETIQQNGGFAGIQAPVGQHLQEGISASLPLSPVPTAQPQPITPQLAPELAFPGADSIRFRTPQEQAGFTQAPAPQTAFPALEPAQPGEFAPLPPVGEFSLPPAQSQINDPTAPSARVSAGLQPSDVVFEPGSPGANIDPAMLANLTEEQIRFLGGRIINRGAPTSQAARPLTPPNPLGQEPNFGQQPSRNNPLIPEGTPVSQINLNGQPAEVPVGIGQLFGGIQGNQVIDKPQSFLGAVGLPLPSAQGFSRLSAGEQDEFFKLARSQGLDPRDVERELQNTRPSGMPVPRIRSAARR